MSDRERQFQLWGWGLFVVCALMYIVSSLESGSLWSLLGSVVFLVACFVFMVPLIRK